MTSDLGKQSLELIQIDYPFCGNSYGTAPCTASGASGSECYNTGMSCQDLPNFDLSTRTITYSRNQETGIFGSIVYPALQSIAVSPARIALGRGEKNLGALGKNAHLKITLSDFAAPDRALDPYENTRAQAVQGTHFGRIRARHATLIGVKIRRLVGYVGDAIGDMWAEEYIITEFAGPTSAGVVTLTAQDPLKLADSDYATCPKASTGKLATAISEAQGVSVALTPTGVGAEYDAAGRVRIGAEIARYTRSGDTLTLVERGADGTTADAQGAGASVQLCYRVDRALPADVIEDLLSTYVGVDASALPKADWASEFSTWLSTLRLTRTISRPTPVKELLSQMVSFGFFLWWDQHAAEFRVKVSRPAAYGEVVPTVTDDTTIIEQSGAVATLEAQRLTQVWIYDGVRNFADGMDDAENYTSINAVVDASAESDAMGGQSQILELYQPWLGRDGAATSTRITAGRLLARYSTSPRQITFTAYIKDRDDLQPGSLIFVSSRLLQGLDGATSDTFMEITSTEELVGKDQIRVTAQSGIGQGFFGFFKPNSAVEYNSASDAEKDAGVYFSDGTNAFPDGRPPYEFF